MIAASYGGQGMAPARLEIPQHAALRLRQRRISRQMIRRCIARGQLLGIDVNGRSIAALAVGKRTLVVVYIAEKHGFLAVTAYWKD